MYTQIILFTAHLEITCNHVLVLWDYILWKKNTDKTMRCYAKGALTECFKEGLWGGTHKWWQIKTATSPVSPINMPNVYHLRFIKFFPVYFVFLH